MGLKKKVEFQNASFIDTAATDGKTIYINAVENAVAKDENDLHALLKHEEAHLLFQTNEATEKLVHEKHKDVDKRIIHDAYNIIEDYRIENNWVRIFPGNEEDFKKLKKNTFENSIQEKEELAKSKDEAKKKKAELMLDNPLSALFAARLGHKEMLKNSPREIQDLYDKFKGELSRTDGRNYLASYPVLDNVIGEMEKWLKDKEKKEAKSTLSQKGKQGEGAEQEGKEGTKGEKEKEETEKEQETGEPSEKGEKKKSEGTKGAEGEKKEREGSKEDGRQPQSMEDIWNSMSEQEKQAIAKEVARQIHEAITELDKTLKDAENEKVQGKMSPEAKAETEEGREWVMRKKTEGLTTEEVFKKATSENKAEISHAISVLAAMASIRKHGSLSERSKHLAESEAHVRVLGSGLNDTDVLPDTQELEGKIRPSIIVKNSLEQIYHRTRQENVKRGVHLNYNKLIQKIANPSKDINVFNKKQKSSGGEYWFLIDLSGSMCGNRINTVKHVVGTLYDSIVPFDSNIKFRMFGYSSSGIVEVNRDTLERVGAEGGNPTGEALGKIYGKMKDDKGSSNKTLFLVTDGGPDQLNAIAETLHFMKLRGIPVFSILIGAAFDEELKKAYSNSAGVYQVNDMSEARPLLERFIVKDVAKRLRA